jgi:hypothetical protein
MNMMAFYCDRIQFHLALLHAMERQGPPARSSREFGLPAKTTMALVRKSAGE